MYGSPPSPSTMVPPRTTSSYVIPRMYGHGVIDHFGINCADWEKSKAFYEKVLGVLGFTRQMDYQVAIGYGADGKPDFWIADMSAGEAAGPGVGLRSEEHTSELQSQMRISYAVFC